jgi:hypothetical protein
VLEAILRNDEVWLSNPLFMNDMEEVRFGINAGANLLANGRTQHERSSLKRSKL